jgi:hypothetical protein
MTNIEFPPFVPAKPKPVKEPPFEGASGPLTGAPVVERRKRRTKAEMDAANGLGGYYAHYRESKREPRTTMIPIEALPMLAGLTVSEAEQVANVCVALETFSKPARKHIVTALAKIYE